MAKTYNRLEIDVNKKPNSIGIRPVQNDTKSRYLDVCLYENGVAINLTGEQVRITFRKADGSTFFNQGEVTDATAGRCQFALTNEILSEAKAVEAQISVWNAGGQILSTEIFTIYVTAAIPWEDSVESENEYGVLVVLFQEIQGALDTMHKIATTFGEPGDKAAEYGVDTFWGILEMLAQRGDVESAMEKKIKAYLNSAAGTRDFFPLDKMIIVNSLLSNNDAKIDWAFRQNGIGSVLNAACNVNSAALAACNTVNEIAASTAALDAILANKQAFELCCHNETIVQMFSDEDIIAADLGYIKFNVGDLVTLNYNGKATKFRVVHKDYLTKGKIVLLSEDCVSKERWDGDYNKYSTSAIRAYLNSTALKGFSQKIQNAIVAPRLLCHDYKTQIALSDKIWLPSNTEVGGKEEQSTPVEGFVFDYYNGAVDSKRIKKFNNSVAFWWLRTPQNGNTNLAKCVGETGGTSHYTVTYSHGVAFAFEI
nr:DUF6273 domain-containing protein [uncultured Anaerotignum sp.]